MLSPLVPVLALLAVELPQPVAVSEGLEGQVVSLKCGRGEKKPSRLERIATDFAQNPPDVVRIDAGNLLGSSALGRLAVAREPQRFAAAMKALGLDAAVLGRKDLATHRLTLLQVARALKGAGLPFIAGNLECDPEAAAVCDALAPAPFLFDQRAVISALGPETLKNVAADRSEGLRITDPFTSLERAAQAAYEAGAVEVIAVYEGSRGRELDETLALAARLAKVRYPPTVLVALHLSEKLYTVAVPGPAPLTVVATESGRAVQVLPKRRTPSAELAPHMPSEVSAWSESVSAWICQTYATTAQPWKLSRALEREQLATLLLDAMREHTHAEVAVLNRSAVKMPEPVEGSITPLDVAAAVPFDNAVQTARVPGALLKTLLAKELFIRGLKKNDNGVIQVNGRTVEDAQPYTLVTNDYLAGGGDGIFTDKVVRFSPPVDLSARELWQAQLERRAANGINADAPTVDPSSRTRWVFRGTADLSLSQTQVVNPVTTVFTDAQLSRSRAIAFRGDIELRADADHPFYTWENGTRLRYGFARTVGGDGVSSGLTETDDLLFLRDTATLRRVGKARFASVIPVPFVESYLESEFTKPDTRGYRHLEWRPIAGLRLPLLPELALFVGGGLDWETLATPDAMPLGEPVAAGVLVGGAQLRPRRLINFGPLIVDGEGTFDVAWRDPTGSSSALIRLHAKLSVPILQTLALTLSYDLFARHMDERLLPEDARRTGGWGFSGDILLGLSFRWTEPVQSFAF